MFVRTMTRPNGIIYQALLRSVWDKEKKQPRQRVIRWLGRVDNKDTRFQMNEAGTETEETISVTRSFRSKEEKFLIDVLKRKRSILLYGNWGVGKTFLAQRVAEQLKAEGVQPFYFRWSSPQGTFISAIADALNVETKAENDKGKPIKRNQNEVFDDIGEALAKGRKVLIVDKAQSIPVSLRNQFEVWLEQGATILLCATLPKRAELFLKFPRYELLPINRTDSAHLVRATANSYGLKLKSSTVNELVTLGNGNPQFLMRAVAENDIGSVSDPDQAEWIDGTPIVIGALCLLLLLRFIGRGMNDQNLVLMGGISMVILRLAMLTVSRVSKKRRIIE